MAYVQCVHCRRSTVTHSLGTFDCARCGAQLPNPAGCETSIERHLRIPGEPITPRPALRLTEESLRVAA